MEKQGLTAAVTGRTDINYHLKKMLPPTKYLELEKASTNEKWGLEPEQKRRNVHRISFNDYISRDSSIRPEKGSFFSFSLSLWHSPLFLIPSRKIDVQLR
jgi:hypothetical protein